jgi:hypothetical protein
LDHEEQIAKDTRSVKQDVNISNLNDISNYSIKSHLESELLDSKITSFGPQSNYNPKLDGDEVNVRSEIYNHSMKTKAKFTKLMINCNF